MASKIEIDVEVSTDVKSVDALTNSVDNLTDSTEKLVDVNEENRKKLKDLKKEYSDLLLESKIQKLTEDTEKLKKGTEEIIPEVKTLKQQYKEALLEAQKGSVDAAKKAALLKDQLDDVSDAVNSVKGDPIEVLGGTFDNVKGSIASLDFGKVSTQLKGAGDAAKNFNTKDLIGGLKDSAKGFGSLATSIIGNPMFLVAGVVAGITYAIYQWITSESALEKQTRLAQEAEAARFSKLQGQYDNQVAHLKRIGASQAEIFQAEQKALESQIEHARVQIETDNAVFDNKISQFAAIFNLNNKEAAAVLGKSKEYLDSINQRAEAENKLAALQSQLDDNRTNNIKDIFATGVKANAESIKDQEETNAKNEKNEQERLNKKKKAQAELDASLKEDEDRVQKRAQENGDNLTKEYETTYDEIHGIVNDNFLKPVEHELKQLPEVVKEVNNQMVEDSIGIFEGITANAAQAQEKYNEFLKTNTGQAVSEGVNQAQNLLGNLDSAFKASTENQLAAANGNEALMDKIRKKAFDRDKKLKIAQATINAFKGAGEALASVPPPFNFLAAAAALAFGFVQVRNIAKQQYNSGGGGADTSGGSSSPSSGGLPTPETNPGVAFNPNVTGQASGNSNQNNSNEPKENMLKVFVTEIDITNSQNKVSVIQQKATIG